MSSGIDRRLFLSSVSAVGLAGLTNLGLSPASAQPSAADAPSAGAAPANTNWYSYAADLSSTRYAPLDQINAANFNSLEVAWRFSTDNYGPKPESYFNATPLVVNRRLYSTVGADRQVVCLDPGTGEIHWTYRHDEKGRSGVRPGSGWGMAYWTDGQVERVLYVTRSYQLVSLDATRLSENRPGPGRVVPT